VTAGHLYGRPDLEALPEAERPIVGRALAKEPGDRWPDCRSFVEALAALDDSEAPETIPSALRASERVPPGALGDFDETPLSSWSDLETGVSDSPLKMTGNAGL
jgi:hypothetical protein